MHCLSQTADVSCRSSEVLLLILPFQDWELLVLLKLQWEATAITPLDYLDHAIPRLGLEAVSEGGPGLSESDLRELRRRTETILVLCATHYQFAYCSSSLVAASAVLSALHSLSSAPDYTDLVGRELKLRIQTVTHTATVSACSLRRRWLPRRRLY